MNFKKLSVLCVLALAAFGLQTTLVIPKAHAEEPVVTQLTFGNNDFLPTWSPDGSQIAFIRDQKIWVVPTSGGSANPIADVGGWGDPEWSPDGESIAFSRDDHIWTIPANGGEPIQVTTEPLGVGGMPAWSPDGSQIAFFALRNGGINIWRIPASGGEATQVTFGQVEDRAPAWSPNGNEIAFSSLRTGTGVFEVWVVPVAEGGVPRQLTASSGFSASWSPDGNYITYGSIESGGLPSGEYIWVIPSEGGEQKQVTFNSRTQDPAWSPDGDHIAYSYLAFENNSLNSNIWITTIPPAPVESSSWGKIKARYWKSGR